MSKEGKTEDIPRADVPESTTTQEEYFNTKTWRTDLALIVEDKKFHVSKHVLAIVSPVFEAMFNGEFSEKDKDEIVMPGKKYNDVLEFLRCIYPNTSSPVTLKNVNVVLPLAEEYQVAKLKASCESCLLARLTNDISTDQLLVILSKAGFYNLLKVTERGIAIASDRPYTEVDKVDTKVALSRDIKDGIRDKMLQKMDKKYKDVVQYVDTSKTLCKFLVEVSEYKHLISAFLKAQVVGNNCSMSVSSEFEKAVNLQIDGIPFTIRIGKTAKSDRVSAFISCSLEKQINIPCFIVVIVQNWMKGKENMIKTSRYSQNISNSETELLICPTSQLLCEGAGFIFKDIFNICFYLFAFRQ